MTVVGTLVTAYVVVNIVSCQMPPDRARPDSSWSSHTSRTSRRAETSLEEGWPQANRFFHQKSYPELTVSLPEIEGAQKVGADQLCMTCHETYYNHFQENVHRGQSCEDCHGPASRHLETRGREPGSIFNFHELEPAQSSELCLKCHEQNACEPGAQWRVSAHAHNNVACVDCHTSHYNVPEGTEATEVPGGLAEAGTSNVRLAGADGNNDEFAALLESSLESAATAEPIAQNDGTGDDAEQESLRGTSNNLGAVAPDVCYRCHQETRQLAELADPHQIGGPNGFNCTTCHDPHGVIRASSRTELCLECHEGAPTMAWHTATHSQEGVACTDCHNPHPNSHVQQVVDIRHTNVRRPKRLPMAVQEPDVCYKCHADVYGQNSMPSHHPIREGKMVCSDCHDGHGQFEGNLKEASVNQVCYRCHAEVQGPFVYEHPPVTEDCTICHEPHGTVENNLLRQPATFLCLRCHSGHRNGPTFHDFGLLPDIGKNPDLQKAFFSDCTQCHSQIHGSDVPSPHNPGVFAR